MRLLCEHCYQKPHSAEFFDQYSVKFSGRQLCRALLNQSVLESLPNRVGAVLKTTLLPMIIKEVQKLEEGKIKQITMLSTDTRCEDVSDDILSPDASEDDSSEDDANNADVTVERNISSDRKIKDGDHRLTFSVSDSEEEEYLSDVCDADTQSVFVKNDNVTIKNNNTVWQNRTSGRDPWEKKGIMKKLADLDSHLKYLEEELAKNGRDISSLQIATGASKVEDGAKHAGDSDSSDGASCWMIDPTGSGLLNFIQTCLQEPKYKRVIRWVNTTTTAEKQFEILDGHKFAEMWGREKKKEGMTQRKLNRSLSYLVKNKGKLIRCAAKKLRFIIVASTRTLSPSPSTQKESISSQDDLTKVETTVVPNYLTPKNFQFRMTQAANKSSKVVNSFLTNQNEFSANFAFTNNLSSLLKQAGSSNILSLGKRSADTASIQFNMQPSTKRIQEFSMSNIQNYLQNDFKTSTLDLPISNYMSTSNSPMNRNLSSPHSSSASPLGSNCGELSPYNTCNTPQSNPTKEILNQVTIALENSVRTDSNHGYSHDDVSLLSNTFSRPNSALSNNSREQSLTSPISYADLNNNTDGYRIPKITYSKADHLDVTCEDIDSIIGPSYFTESTLNTTFSQEERSLDVDDSILDSFLKIM